MSVPQHIIDQLVDTADIVSIIGRHVSLKRAGKDFKGCCPFHQEKTPSFYVSPQKGFYHCYGCKASGNAISFLMEYERLSFLESLDVLSSQTGIQIPKSAPNPQVQYKKNSVQTHSPKPRTQKSIEQQATQPVTQAPSHANQINQQSAELHSELPSQESQSQESQGSVLQNQEQKSEQNTQQPLDQSHAQMMMGGTVDVNDLLSAAVAEDMPNDELFFADVSAVGSADNLSNNHLSNLQHLNTQQPNTQTNNADTSGNLYQLLTEIADYYQAQLAKAPKALLYLNQRGLSEQTIHKFALGYAPKGWNHLEQQFPRDIEGLKILGLVREKENARGHSSYDLLRDRVIFPIRDHKGRVVGFGGRTLDKDGQPKYINSPESVVFKKQHILYGLYEGRKAKAENWLMVEGYMDVIALYQAGIFGAVASMGTATNAEQLKKLFKQNPQLTLAFDGDRAGRSAAWRTLELALPILEDSLELRFLLLPEKEDPDSLVKAEGKQAFESRIDNAPPLSEFLFNELASQCDLNKPEGKSQLMNQARKMLSTLPEYGSYKRLLMNEIKDKLGLSYKPFNKNQSNRNQFNKNQPFGNALAKYTDSLLNFDSQISLEQQLGFLLLRFPKLLTQLASLEAYLPDNSLLKQLFGLIVQTEQMNSLYQFVNTENNMCQSVFLISTLLALENDKNALTRKQLQQFSDFMQFMGTLSQQMLSIDTNQQNTFSEAHMQEIASNVMSELGLKYKAKLLKQKLDNASSLAEKKQFNDALAQIRKQLQFREI